jgi:hypothetical protein
VPISSPLGHRHSPQVINAAFQLLTGSHQVGPAGTDASDASTPAPSGLEDPLGAVLSLTRALWEVMHMHALCRKLAKPFKVVCALRNILLLADVPLYAR